VSGAGSRGFTLLELVVVLTLLSLLLIVLPPAIRGGGDAGLRAAAHDVAAGLRRAQSEAVARNRAVAFVLDVNAHRFRVGAGGATRALPDDVALRLYTAGSELIDAATGAIRFYPDGSSTGGEITLSSETRDYHVAVDWLTGRVSIRH
jgi:general secretion pathway protein H